MPISWSNLTRTAAEQAARATHPTPAPTTASLSHPFIQQRRLGARFGRRQLLHMPCRAVAPVDPARDTSAWHAVSPRANSQKVSGCRVDWSSLSGRGRHHRRRHYLSGMLLRKMLPHKRQQLRRTLGQTQRSQQCFLVAKVTAMLCLSTSSPAKIW